MAQRLAAASVFRQSGERCYLCGAREAVTARKRPRQGRRSSGLAILEPVFPVDGIPIALGEKPALGLSEVQVEGARLAAGGQKFSDIGHVSGGLVFRRKLLERDQRG